jgi:lipopolysaccharide transport system ATP-binding protein
MSNNTNNQSPDDDVLVRVENVSKKFCKSLKRSLWYGVKDIATELNPFGRVSDGLRVTSDERGEGEKHLSVCEAELRKDEFWAVKDVSFELRRGECLGLIGHNGAGKSTLLKMLNGIIKPDHGRIEMRGRVSALIELGAGFNPVLTGRENIYNKGAILGFTKKEIDEKFDEIVEFGWQ